MAKKAIDIKQLEAFAQGRSVDVVESGSESKQKVKSKDKKSRGTKRVEPPEEQETLKQVNLRIYPSQIDWIDALLAYRRKKTSRNVWLQEAVEEKIAREAKKYKITEQEVEAQSAE